MPKIIFSRLAMAMLFSLPMMFGGVQSASAGECSRSYTPDYVRMTQGGVYRNNWRQGNFLQLNGWNEVPARFGVPVAHAQARTCGCTQYSGNPPRHPNATCQRALNSGLR